MHNKTGRRASAGQSMGSVADFRSARSAVVASAPSLPRVTTVGVWGLEVATAFSLSAAQGHSVNTMKNCDV